ncbi:MAG: YabP/YqfC family sporulation protein [Clostridia bacterium]|nr:YabP/YqfC family sporulation protein [Clostridia bacterium]
MEAGINNKDSIMLVIGKSFSMSGVNDIRGFDDGYILLDTTSGRITVEGSDLKIESLSKDGGNILVKGGVTGVFSSVIKEGRKGIIKRLFG